MKIGELREKLSTLYKEHVGAVAYFILKNENQTCIRMIDIKAEFLNDLLNCYLQSISNFIMNTDKADVAALQLTNISTADQRKDTLYEYDLEAVPAELSFFESITQVGEQQIFSSKSESLKNLYGYVIAIGNGQSKVLLFRKHYPINLFCPDKNLLFFESNHRFIKLEKDMIRLDHNFDLLFVEGKIIVKNLKLLESFLGFHDIIKREATLSVAAITAAKIVDNPETLSEMLKDVSFARKLTKTATNSPVLGKIPTASIVQFTKNHPALKNKIRFSTDESRLHLDTKESKKLFLKLLNDDFLRSELTKAYYDSLAKDPLVVEKQGGAVNF